MSDKSNTSLVISDNQALVEVDDIRLKYEQIEQDYDEVKDNLLKISDKVNTSLPDIIDYAQAVPGPKSYEALAKVIIAISTLNRDTASVIAQRKQLLDSLSKVNPRDKEDEGKQTYNDNRTVVFNGSPSDLLGRIRRSDD